MTATMLTLSRREARRFTLNPVFLLAAVLTAYILWNRQRGLVADVNTVTVYPAIFLGGFGMVTAFWLTQSMRGSADALDVAPTSWPARTAAICLAAVVPLLCGVLSLVAIGVFQKVQGDWSFGSRSLSDLVAAVLSQTVVPALGGPLLGVALGRWVRFPGTAIVSLLVLYGWVTLTYVLAAASPYSVLTVMVRFFAPFTFFTNEDNPGQVETWRGAPWFFVGWQLCLCAVAVIVALLRGADPELRSRLVKLLGGVAGLAIVMYVLAVIGGPAYPFMTTG